MYISILIAGFGGGAVRGILGFVKHQFSYKSVGFDVKYFLTMVFVSGIAGVLCAVAIKETGINILSVPFVTPGIAFIIGYAGGDFLESIYKIIIKK